MANSIALFKKYIDLLDEVYKGASCTSSLDIDGAMVKAGANANEIVIPKMKLDGLADYSRNSGYVKGDIDFTYQTVTFNYDRGRKFNVDAMDNAETAGLAFGKLASEFIRTQVVPEMDAFRFAAYSAATDIGEKAGSYNSGEDVISALREGVNVMDEAEVPAEGRYLFITPTLMNAAMDVNTYISKDVMGGFTKIIKVPQTRFYTGIDLYDGTTTGETGGGFRKACAKYELTDSQPADWATGYANYYTKSGDVYTPLSSAATWAANTYYKQTSAGGADINFMIIHKPAVIQFCKHIVSKVIPPEDNIDADAYTFTYRAYGITDVYGSRAAGIYLNRKAIV